MEIQTYFDSIKKRVGTTKKFEKEINIIAKLINSNPNSNKIIKTFNRLLKIIEKTSYKERRIDINVINEIKKEYYKKQNLEFIVNLFKGFKDIKQELGALSVENFNRNSNMDKYKENLSKINLLKEQVSISLRYIFTLNSQTSSYNEIKTVEDSINEIMFEKDMNGISTTIDLKSKNSVDNLSIFPNLTTEDVLKIYKEFYIGIEQENPDFISTYFVAETSDNENNNNLVSKVKKEYLVHYEAKIKALQSTELSQNNYFLENIIFLKALQPLINKVDIKKQKYSDNYPNNPVKQCERLIKKLKNDNNFKQKMDKLCKKYNVNENYIKSVGNKLLSEKQSNIIKNIKDLKLHKTDFKQISSKITSTKWSISWRKFFSKKIGICKRIFKDSINLYIKIKEKLYEERKKISEKIELKTNEILPKNIKERKSDVPTREITTVVGFNQITKKGTTLRETTDNAEKQGIKDSIHQETPNVVTI